MENLVLRVDGSFQQTVRYDGGEHFAVNDVWTNEDRHVTMNRLYITDDVMEKRTLKPPELRHMVYLMYWPNRLIKDAESGYVFHKTGQAKAP